MSPGVYLTPPQNVVVLCVDEKSQIQALDRIQPGLPLKCGPMPYFHSRLQTQRHHDTLCYPECGGKTTDWAMLPALSASGVPPVFAATVQRIPPGKQLQLILDNYGTHGHPRIRQWLTRHSRFILHFIPTSSSWLNLVERLFAELSQKAVRRRVFQSAKDLGQAFKSFCVDSERGTNP